MKRILLCTSALLVLLAVPALAQPVESEPLPAPYTIHGETDPMATGGAPAPEMPVNRGETIIAPPPPGADTIPQAESAPVDAPSTGGAHSYTPPQPQAATGPDNQITSYPNNNVSGVPYRDESKFETMRFCTLKISFTSIGAGIDTKTADKVNSYLHQNADKITYTTERKGKEGEFSLCLDIAEHSNRSRVYKDLKKIVQGGTFSKPTAMTGKGFAPVSPLPQNDD